MAPSTHERTWDRAARVYGRQEQLELQAVGRALDLLAPAPSERLLDVGTGTGLVLRELARRPGRPAHAVGLDASREMLARVGALPDGWALGRGEATALPWAEASFEVAVSSYVLHILAPGARAAALAELHRVVAPGGRVVVVTPWSPRVAARAALTGLARAAPASLGGLRTLDPRPGLAAAGFRVERAAALRHGYPSLVVSAKRDGGRSNRSR